jgi:hypothetical protein
MRLIFPRAAAARTLLVAAAAAAAVTTVLLVAFLQYAYLLPQAGVRQAVADAPTLERSIMLTSGAGRDAGELAGRDAATRELFGGGLAGVPLTVHAGGYGTSQRLPHDLPGVEAGPYGAYAVVAFLPGLDQHARLVEGAWPEPVAAGEPAQVALPSEVAAALELAVGDRVAIVDEIADEDRPVEVVGRWQPSDPGEAYWQLAATPLGQDGWGPFVVHPDEFTARYQRLAKLEWLAVGDPSALARAGMPEVAAGLGDLAAELERHRSDPASPLDATARLRSDLNDLAGRLTTATVVNRSGLVLPAALLAVIATYGLVLVARLLTAHRRGENALLRARGASRRQLVRFTTAEALLVAVPAAALGPPAGTWLVRVADERAGDRSLGLAADLAGYGWTGPPAAWGIAVVATLGCALALALPAAGRGRTWVAEQQERSRPGRAALAQRAGVDLVLVGLAVLAWTQLRQYGQAVTPRDVGGLGVDPLLVAAPVVAVLAATAVALRVLPLATRLGVAVAARRNTFPGLLGMWQADRRPHAGPVLLLVLAVATAVLAPTVASTWQQSQRDQARQAVGADLRLSAAGSGPEQQVRELGELPGVSGVMAAHRELVRLPEGERVPLLALDTPQAGQVAHVRHDLSPAGAGALFAALHADRPQPAGVALPEGARRLVGTVHFDGPDAITEVQRFTLPSGGPLDVPITNPAPASHGPSVHVVDDRGVVSSMRIGSVFSDDPIRLDVPLPPGAAQFVGVSAGLQLPSGYVIELMLEHDQEAAPVEVSWRWEDLAVLDRDGNRVPLELPDHWEVLHHPDQQHGRTVPVLERAAGGVTTSVTQGRHPPQTVPFLVAAPFDVPAVPALFTPQTLAAAGGEAGGDLDVGGVTVRVAGTVGALPGVADGQGIAADLAWVTLHRLREMRLPPAPNEWWLATTDPATVSVRAAELPVTVHDQRGEADRLLRDPLGSGVLLTLWAAAAGAALLAAFGLAVDSRANAVRRHRELAVLHTLGVSPAGLARALVVEQAVLAGLGVVAGVAVGVAVAAAMGTSLVLTPAGAVPVPVPLLALSPAQAAAPAAGLWVVAVVLGAVVARRARRDVAAGALRIGED